MARRDRIVECAWRHPRCGFCAPGAGSGLTQTPTPDSGRADKAPSGRGLHRVGLGMRGVESPHPNPGPRSAWRPQRGRAQVPASEAAARAWRGPAPLHPRPGGATRRRRCAAPRCGPRSFRGHRVPRSSSSGLGRGRGARRRMRARAGLAEVRLPLSSGPPKSGPPLSADSDAGDFQIPRRFLFLYSFPSASSASSARCTGGAKSRMPRSPSSCRWSGAG